MADKLTDMSMDDMDLDMDMDEGEVDADLADATAIAGGDETMGALLLELLDRRLAGKS